MPNELKTIANVLIGFLAKQGHIVILDESLPTFIELVWCGLYVCSIFYDDTYATYRIEIPVEDYIERLRNKKYKYKKKSGVFDFQSLAEKISNLILDVEKNNRSYTEKKEEILKEHGVIVFNDYTR